MKTKTERQQEVVEKWLVTKCSGFEAPTGFGKTRTAIQVALRLKEDNLLDNLIVIVPTLVLKEQWIMELAKFKLPAQVIVINTASKLTNKYKCSLLIIDEAHTCVAETFINVFNTVEYQYLLWLTATVERQDKRHELLIEKAPICDSITLEECLANQWISEYVIYNLAVPFNEEELNAYKKADNTFRYYASQLGFGGQSFKTAQQYLKTGTSQQKAIAIIYYNCIRKRKLIITNNSNKVNYTLDVINKFPDEYGIVFSESIDFANRINQLIPDVSVSIHSKMTKKQQKESFRVFKDGRTKKRVIASVKALTAGLDIPKLSYAVAASFNSSKLVGIQSIGRILRPLENKQAKMVNLYIPNSQEERWLLNRQKDQPNIRWIKSINEII